MNENLRAILEAVSEDEGLKAEVTTLMTALGNADGEGRPELVARAIALADEHGLELTEEDLAFEATTEGRLEDEELVTVAGGCRDIMSGGFWI